MLCHDVVKDFFCSEARCTRFYNSTSGYFDEIDGYLVPQEADIEICTVDDCGSPMYLESVLPNMSEKWRCPQERCGGTRTVRRYG